MLGLNASEWMAIGTLATAVILLVTLVFVVWQVREARALRREQFRPWVTVGFHFRSIVAFVAVQNLGSTVARNVRIRFEPELVSTQWDDVHAVGLFVHPIPALVPGEKRITRFERVPDRLKSDLPMRHTATVTYEDHRGRALSAEEFVLDFGQLAGDTIPDKGMHDLVEEVRQIRKALPGAE